MSCREFFERHAGSGATCRELQKLDVGTTIAWEAESASKHSPGPVTNQEELARQVLNPVYFDAETGNVKPSLFSEASSRGASANRLQMIGEEAVHQLGNARAETVPGRGYVGFVHVSASEVRAILTNVAGQPAERGLGVYDTALEHDPSHADICQVVGGDAKGKSVRGQLYELAKGRLRRPNDP